MVGRAIMVVAAMVEEAMVAVAEVLTEAGVVVAMVAEVEGVVALDEAGAVLAAGDVELKTPVAVEYVCTAGHVYVHAQIHWFELIMLVHATTLSMNRAGIDLASKAYEEWCVE